MDYPWIIHRLSMDYPWIIPVRPPGGFIFPEMTPILFSDNWPGSLPMGYGGPMGSNGGQQTGQKLKNRKIKKPYIQVVRD